MTTKVTEAEYGRLEERAVTSGLNLIEWVRGRLLVPPSDGNGTEQVLGEVLALRSILLNLFFKMSQGEAVPAEEMKTIIERADSGKVDKALARLQPVSSWQLKPATVHHAKSFNQAERSHVFGTMANSSSQAAPFASLRAPPFSQGR